MKPTHNCMKFELLFFGATQKPCNDNPNTCHPNKPVRLRTPNKYYAIAQTRLASIIPIFDEAEHYNLIRINLFGFIQFTLWFIYSKLFLFSIQNTISKAVIMIARDDTDGNHDYNDNDVVVGW